MPTIQRPDGCEVYYEDSGGPGPALLLGHGFLMDHRSFDAQTEALTEYRVVRWDLRDHGQTTSHTAGYSFWDQARDGLAIAEHLEISEAVFGGHSQGGFVALRMALLSPQTCRGLLLFSTSDTPYSPEYRQGYRSIFESWNPRSPEGRGFATTLATTMIGGELPFMQLWRQRWAEHSGEGFLDALDCLLEADDVRTLTPDLTMPALIIRGESDQAFSHDDVMGLANRLGGDAELVTISRSTHGAHMTDSDEVNTHVRRWLTSIGF